MVKDLKETTGIILAGGRGTRLGEITKDTLKPLLDLHGHPLIAYVIGFVKELGLSRIIVIGGHKFDSLKEIVNRLDPAVEVVYTPHYMKGTLHGLGTVLDELTGSFLLFHDHIYRKDIVYKVKKHLQGGVVAFTDRDRQLGNDDMKVIVDEKGVLKQISKGLQSDIGYVGITYCGEELLDLYKKATQEAKKLHGDRAVTEQTMQYLADHNMADIYIADISGSKWLEIDYPEELQNAQDELQKHQNLYQYLVSK